MPASKFDTIWPADCLEFCPHPGAEDIFVCGTYHLDEPTPSSPKNVDVDEDGDEELEALPPRIQKRRGKCLVFQITDRSKCEFQQLQEIPLPAVPDMKWCHRSPSANALLGIADSEGNISLHEWQLEQKILKPVQSIAIASSTTLCLSLDWSNRLQPSSSSGSLIVSLSNGELCLLKPHDDELRVTDRWHAHDYEPWIAAWNYWDQNIVYSGGDDMKLKGWDVRQGFDSPTFVNKRFDAGITTIQSHPHIEHLLVVGSYDANVRLFDARAMHRPLSSTPVGGGVWRTKWHPHASRKGDVLVACMHDGFKVVHFDVGSDGGKDYDWGKGASGEGVVVKRFDEHASLAYGADWSFSPDETGKSLVGSCSFYDHAMHLWDA
ncbi:hypothetical protein PLICRDRAFT_153974 [Plicaturopsis crispa FD-325 SS-3]|nr:hypothetical protein PLICRDRAFT_153974 [Plicaturopsis crispa FD-325 SS-3]